MLELPRACIIAERVARHADFFSFGTNDLTQTTIGLSRDDVEGRFIGAYLEQGILDQSPFETIDEPGVGAAGPAMGAERRAPGQPRDQAGDLRRAWRRPAEHLASSTGPASTT